jgi:hypothetical protein
VTSLYLSTEIRSNEFPAIFNRFEQTIGSNVWHRRVTRIREEVRGNQYLRDYLHYENRVAFVLEAYSKHKASRGAPPSVFIQDAAHYDAVAFVTQTVAFMEAAEPDIAGALRARVRGAFNNPSDFRGLALEMLIATHLQRQSALIQLPTDGTYDWLAERDGLSFEVECKSISNDKGRPVHYRESLDLFNLAKKALGKITDRVVGGLLVDVRLPGRLPSAHSIRKEICTEIRRAVLSGAAHRKELAAVSTHTFSLAELTLRGDASDNALVNDFLKRRYGALQGRYAAAHTTRGGGLLVLAVGSEIPEDTIGETMQEVKDAASDQLTGVRPGVVCVKLEGVTAAELVELAEAHPTALSRGLSELWQSTSMRRVAHVVFLADDKVEQKLSGAWSRGGMSYDFENPSSSHKGDSRLELFSTRRGAGLV